MRRAVAVVLFLTVLFTGFPKEAASGQAWAVIDADTGRLLSGYNENAKLPIASLTKMWTALTYLESGVTEESVRISPEAAMAEGSSIYLQQGIEMPAEALLYGLMLRSGNDAAYALAEHAGGSLEGFVDMMNDKALLYGLKDTTFANPSGLHDEKHLSTAYDTAKMLYFAMQNEAFEKIATSKSYTYNGGEVVRSWSNKHRLIHTNPDAKAGKTGFTKVAGRTLATYFERDGKRIIIVTLNDGNDWKDHTDLANETFKKYDLVTVAKKGAYDILPGVEGRLETPIRVLLKPEEKGKISHIVRIPRGKEKTSIGTWTVSFDHQPIISTEVLIHQ